MLTLGKWAACYLLLAVANKESCTLTNHWGFNALKCFSQALIHWIMTSGRWLSGNFVNIREWTASFFPKTWMELSVILVWLWINCLTLSPYFWRVILTFWKLAWAEVWQKQWTTCWTDLSFYRLNIWPMHFVNNWISRWRSSKTPLTGHYFKLKATFFLISSWD